MKILIKNKQGKLLTEKTFNSIEEATLEKKKNVKLWLKMLKNEPLLPKTRLNNWRKCIFEATNYINNCMQDFDIVALAEQRRTIIMTTTSKALKQYDSAVISRKTDNYLATVEKGGNYGR